jgi:hypothetical protein
VPKRVCRAERMAVTWSVSAEFIKCLSKTNG